MQFSGPELEGILSRQESAVAIYDEDSYYVDIVQPQVALREAKRVTCFGVGNRKRIRYLRRSRQQYQLHDGSRVTRRLRGEVGPLGDQRRMREHRWKVRDHPFRR